MYKINYLSFTEQDIPDEILSFIYEIEKHKISGLSHERLVDTALAIIYACQSNLPGPFVECGVESGGNPILAAKIFDFFNKDNKVYLFDTFNGMTEPSDIDISPFEGNAIDTYQIYEEKDEKWCFASLEDVKNNFKNFEVSTDRCEFIVGDVRVTLSDSKNIPNDISVLRLDTDWYDSTKVELEALYPNLSIGGVLLLDDYGYWDGCKKAVDDFFKLRMEDPMLRFVDAQGCNHIKVKDVFKLGDGRES